MSGHGGEYGSGDRAPVHRIVAFTGGDENVGITACGGRIEHPNRPTQVGRFTADRSKVTCADCDLSGGER